MLLHSLRTNRSSSSALLGCATHHRFVALRELTRAHVNPDDHPALRKGGHGTFPKVSSIARAQDRTMRLRFGRGGAGTKYDTRRCSLIRECTEGFVQRQAPQSTDRRHQRFMRLSCSCPSGLSLSFFFCARLVVLKVFNWIAAESEEGNDVILYHCRPARPKSHVQTLQNFLPWKSSAKVGCVLIAGIRFIAVESSQ